ncbi:MAG: RIP metalloprotease RseP [Alistipes sp.]|nr:RIP metalloprotease RseP [Alistipes sp.]
MEIFIKIIQFFLCFTILVGIHELGHFVMARIFGIRVEKFYIFFDPWFSLFKFKRGDTEYGIGWLPMGGYVKIAGMIDESMDKEQLKRPVQPWEFRAKPAWQRFLVMIAGVVMNVVLAIVIYCGVCYTWGDTYFSNEDARWGYAFNESGHRLGFEDGDRFVSVDGQPVDDPVALLNALLINENGRRVVVERHGEEVALDLSLEALIAMRQEQGYENLFRLREPFIVDSVVTAAGLRKGDEIIALNQYRGLEFFDYKALLQLQAGEEVDIEVLRGADTLTLTLPVDADGRLGVVAANPYTPRTRYYTFLESVPAGFRKAGRTLSSYWQQLKLIVQPKTELYKEVGGFLSIGNIFSSTWNWHDFWLKTAFLSIILAVMNIIPIPGLDGGHAIFTLWEMLTGRKVSDKVLEVAQYAGLLLLLALLLYVNGNDFYRFFIK